MGNRGKERNLKSLELERLGTCKDLLCFNEKKVIVPSVMERKIGEFKYINTPINC